MLKVAITGSSGRMGHALHAACVAQHGIEVVAVISRKGPSYSLAQVTHAVDVVIDFSHPALLAEHLTWCVKHGVRLLIGTTGLNSEHKALIGQAAQTLPIVLAPNTSIGVNV